MQRNQQKYFHRRNHYYSSNKYISSYGRNELGFKNLDKEMDPYSTLKTVHAISIVDFTLFSDDNRVFRKYGLLDEETYKPLSDAGGMIIHNYYIELPKYGKYFNKLA